MIVQSAPEGSPALVIEQLEHTRLAGRFAEVWGNDEFAPIEPREPMLYVIAHHDEGWDEVDAKVGRDAQTGLPWNLVKTPLPQVLASGARGPALNEAKHPLCGLISSMHTYGLYHGRYGLSDKVFVDMVPAEHRPAVDAMLEGERARQARLQDELRAMPGMAVWAEPDRVFHNYKLLQFFDTLALYFNCVHEDARGTSAFPNVPRKLGEDVTVTVSRVERGVYAFDPFPFVESGVEVAFEARSMTPQPEGTDMAAALRRAPLIRETMRLVRV